MSKIQIRTSVSVILCLLVGLVAGAFIRGRGKSSRDVKPEELDRLLDKADRIVVLSDAYMDRRVLYESSERRDIDALKTALRVGRPPEYIHCMCLGTTAIYLFSGETQVGLVTNQHTERIRCNLWGSDAPLMDPEAFLRWFDERGIKEPRRDYEADVARSNESAKAERNWLAAMPSSLHPYWPDAMRQMTSDFAPLRAALAKQFPNQNSRILALYGWYGSGHGPWSGFPEYEVVAEKLLLDYQTPELLAAAEGEMNTAQTEGCARLFGGWTFWVTRPNDLALLPQELKSRLLKHSLESSDEDKRRRARHAFEER